MRWFRKPAPFAPRLTFSPDVTALLTETYRAAGTILEYGSGGSTDLAASMGKQVWSVESDAAWAAGMRGHLDAHHPGHRVTISHVDIGRTKSWGRPRNVSRMAEWHLYPLAVWDMPGLLHPDVILIDGRFRVACLVTALMRVTRPTCVLFDDYAARPAYAVVEQAVRPARIVETMAVFDLAPGMVRPSDLTWMIGAFTRWQ